MVRSALRDWLEFYVRDQAGGAVEVPPGARKESLELTSAASSAATSSATYGRTVAASTARAHQHSSWTGAAGPPRSVSKRNQRPGWSGELRAALRA
jgi:hypothetical protein